MAGCKTGTSTNQATQQTTQDKSESKTSAEGKKNFNETGYPIVNEKITVKSVYSSYEVYGDPKEMSTWQALEEITNIHIEWDRIEDEQLELYFAAGDLPDFFMAGLDNKKLFQYGVEGGLFYDLTEFINKYMPNLSKAFEKYPTAKKIVTQINGEIYTLPRIVKSSTAAAARMHYRKDYVEKVGLGIPTTVDEFYNVAKAIKDSGLTGGYAPIVSAYNFFTLHTEPFLFAAFGDSVDVDFSDDGSGKVVYNRMSEQYKRYLKYMNKLYKEGILDNEYLTIDSATAEARMKAGQGAFSVNGTTLNESDFPDGIIHLDVLAPLTSEYTDKKKIIAYDYYSTKGGAISKKSKYPEELCRMFDIWFAPEEVVEGSGLYCESFVYGIYGKEWVYTDETKTTFEQIIPDWWDSSSNYYLYKYSRWEHDFGLFDNMMVGGQGNNLARQLGYIKNNIPYAVEGFPAALLKFTIDEQSVITSKYQDIQSYVMEMRSKYIAGIESIDDTWDTYCETLRQMGIDDVIAAYQSAYERWNK